MRGVRGLVVVVKGRRLRALRRRARILGRRAKALGRCRRVLIGGARCVWEAARPERYRELYARLREVWEERLEDLRLVEDGSRWVDGGSSRLRELHAPPPCPPGISKSAGTRAIELSTRWTPH